LDRPSTEGFGELQSPLYFLSFNISDNQDEVREALSETVSMTPSPSSASLVPSASSASLTGIVVESPPELGSGDNGPASSLPQISLTDVVRLVADIECMVSKVRYFFICKINLLTIYFLSKGA
jgi:hypothetical protein